MGGEFMQRTRAHRSPRLARESASRHDESFQPAANSGQPLAPDVRIALESTFGQSLENVRVFSDSEADTLAGSYSAAALTIGQDVFFKQGMYDPRTPHGLFLLSHEIAHTVQQQDAKPGGPLARTHAGDACERDATAAASRTMHGQPANVQASSDLAAAPFGLDDMFGLKTAGEWLGDTVYEATQTEAPDGSNPAFGAGLDMAKTGASGLGFIKDVADLFTKEAVPNADASGMVDRSNPLVSTAGTALSVLGAGIEGLTNKNDGQDWGEAFSGPLASLTAGLVGGGPSYGAGDKGVNMVNTVAGLVHSGAKLFGASEETQEVTQATSDVTTLASDATGSSMQDNILKQGFRGLWNIGEGVVDTWDQLGEGDIEGAILRGGGAIDKQVTDMMGGKAGSALQGWALGTDLISSAFSGKDMESELLNIDGAETTSAGRIGSWLGDQAYQFINEDIPEAQEFAKNDDSVVGNIMDAGLNHAFGLKEAGEFLGDQAFNLFGD
jgi:hypothetical protein